MIDPSTGLPYSDDELEAFEGIEHVRTAHYPDPPSPEAQREIARAEHARRPLEEEIRPLRGLVQNQRGASAILRPQDPGQPIQFVPVLEARAKGDGAETMTLTIGVTAEQADTTFKPNLLFLAGGVAGNPLFFPRATTVLIGRLQWGIGSANFEVFFDLERGTVIPICANWVRFSAAMVLFDPAEPVSFLVNASLGYSGTPAFVSPMRFTQFASLDIAGEAGADAFLPIPPYAQSFGIQTLLNPGGPDPAINPSISILVRGTGTTFPNGFASRFNYVSNSNLSLQFENSFPIWNGAQEIVLTNHAAVITAVKVIYSLAF
jgi:hypothetical protein